MVESFHFVKPGPLLFDLQGFQQIQATARPRAGDKGRDNK